MRPTLATSIQDKATQSLAGSESRKAQGILGDMQFSRMDRAGSQTCKDRNSGDDKEVVQQRTPCPTWPARLLIGPRSLTEQAKTQLRSCSCVSSWDKARRGLESQAVHGGTERSPKSGVGVPCPGLTLGATSRKGTYRTDSWGGDKTSQGWVAVSIPHSAAHTISLWKIPSIDSVLIRRQPWASPPGSCWAG